MENYPLITVVIPTYNRANLILRSLESLKSQTYQNFEIIIVDDASTDNTYNIIREYNNNKIKYIRLEKNVGQSKARNVAIKEAKGEFIGFLDSDDEWLPEKNEKQLAVFHRSQDNKLAAVYCGTIEIDEIRNETYTHEGGDTRGDIYKDLLSGFCPASPTLFLVKKSVLDEVKGFDEFLPTFVDYDLWLRIAKLGYTFDVVNDPLVIKHEHAGSQIAKDPEKRERGLKLFMEKWGEEIKAIAGEKTFKNIKRKKIQALADSISNNPGVNYRKDAKHFLQLLLSVRSHKIKVYIKLLLLATFGKGFLKAVKKIKST